MITYSGAHVSHSLLTCKINICTAKVLYNLYIDVDWAYLSQVVKSLQKNILYILDDGINGIKCIKASKGFNGIKVIKGIKDIKTLLTAKQKKKEKYLFFYFRNSFNSYGGDLVKL